MGNIGSSGRGNSRRRHRNHNNQQHPPPPPTPQPPQAEISGNRYVFAASTPYPPPPPPPPHQYQNPNTPPQYYQYTGYYPPQQQQPPLPAPYDHHHRSGGDPAAAAAVAHANWVGAGGGRYPCGPVPPPPAPYVEHQKAVTIRNDVNIKKETLKLVPDEDNPGHFLISFSFDATVAGSITLMFFAKEGADCNLISMKENMPEAVTVSFQQGLGQIFKQPPATGINFTMFEEAELRKSDDVDVYPLVVKAEASPLDFNGAEEGDPMPKTINAQITQVVFEKDKGEYQVRVVKQMLWVNGMRYELQEIYGIGNSVENEFDGSEQGKECVICLSEPRDTTVLPCRHMCMCSGCAKVLRFQTSRCPICRQPVDRLLEIKVNNKTDD